MVQGFLQMYTRGEALMKLSVIFSNIIGFDGLIFLLAALNVYIFLSAKRAANVLYMSMHHSVYSPSLDKDISSIKNNLEGLTDQKLSSLRETAVAKYTLFINLTAIFPLMGILGTVISLLGMVGDTSDIQGGFFAALTSTFWGLIFAIVFKFLDGFVSPRLEDGERAAELFMQRRTPTPYRPATPTPGSKPSAGGKTAAPAPEKVSETAPASVSNTPETDTPASAESEPPAELNEEEKYARGIIDTIEPFDVRRRKKK